MNNILDRLDSHQKAAVDIISTAISMYKNAGLMNSISRYHRLEKRIQISALSSRTLIEFWNKLLQRMCWSIGPLNLDQHILETLSGQEDRKVLSILAKQSVSVVMIARYANKQKNLL